MVFKITAGGVVVRGGYGIIRTTLVILEPVVTFLRPLLPPFVPKSVSTLEGIFLQIFIINIHYLSLSNIHYLSSLSLLARWKGFFCQYCNCVIKFIEVFLEIRDVWVPLWIGYLRILKDNILLAQYFIILIEVFVTHPSRGLKVNIFFIIT